MNENLKKMIDFVNPQTLKSNIISISLYIAFFETLKDYIIKQPKDFYSVGFNNENEISPKYKTEVLSKDKKNVMNASLMWFKEQEAIDGNDINVFHKLREMRNSLTHEMVQNLYNGIDEKFQALFSQLIDLKIKLEKWWVVNIELPTSDIDIENIDEDEIITSSQILFRLILDTLSEDEKTANFYHSEFLKNYDSKK